jgi:hypothetical protein
MSDLSNLLLLLLLGGAVGLWLKLSAARERAMQIARRLCDQHGLQLLDESVGMRRIRLRRINGLRRIERCYAFEVSLDGKDRQPGRLWMVSSTVTSVSLPSNESKEFLPSSTAPGRIIDNVVPLQPRSDANHRLH